MDFTYYKIYFIMDIYQIYGIKCKSMNSVYHFSVINYKSMIVHDIFQ